MVPVDDPGDQGVVFLARDEVGLAPDRQCVAAERLPRRAQVLGGELLEERQAAINEIAVVGDGLLEPLAELGILLADLLR